MLKYRGANLIRAGILGAVLIVLVIAIGLQPQQLLQWATSPRYAALFAEAGGLAAGNAVTISGIKVGSVSGISLQDGDALVKFSVDGKYRLGSETTAHIGTGTLLGERVLTLQSAGATRLRPNAVIALSHTSSPYSLTDAVSELTTNTAGTNTEALNQSLDTLSATLDQMAPQLGPTFDGLTRLSRSINSRNETLSKLLKGGGAVSGILSQRSAQVNTLILNANDLLAVLVDRQNAIEGLLANTSAVARQLTGVVADNEKKLAPALEKVNSVTAMLEKNRDNIAKALPGLVKYQITQGEAVANGGYYNAFIVNLTPGTVLQPFLDYLWGFRTFDTAPGRGPGFPSHMPRALFPWPHNAIPGGSR